MLRAASLTHCTKISYYSIWNVYLLLVFLLKFLSPVMFDRFAFICVFLSLSYLWKFQSFSSHLNLIIIGMARPHDLVRIFFCRWEDWMNSCSSCAIRSPAEIAILSACASERIIIGKKNSIITIIYRYDIYRKCYTHEATTKNLIARNHHHHHAQNREAIIMNQSAHRLSLIMLIKIGNMEFCWCSLFLCLCASNQFSTKLHFFG